MSLNKSRHNRVLSDELPSLLTCPLMFIRDNNTPRNINPGVLLSHPSLIEFWRELFSRFSRSNPFTSPDSPYAKKLFHKTVYSLSQLCNVEYGLVADILKQILDTKELASTTKNQIGIYNLSITEIGSSRTTVVTRQVIKPIERNIFYLVSDKKIDNLDISTNLSLQCILAGIWWNLEETPELVILHDTSYPKLEKIPMNRHWLYQSRETLAGLVNIFCTINKNPIPNTTNCTECKYYNHQLRKNCLWTKKN